VRYLGELLLRRIKCYMNEAAELLAFGYILHGRGEIREYFVVK
jgi:hypothetical protein